MKHLILLDALLFCLSKQSWQISLATTEVTIIFKNHIFDCIKITKTTINRGVCPKGEYSLCDSKYAYDIEDYSYLIIRPLANTKIMILVFRYLITIYTR